MLNKTQENNFKAFVKTQKVKDTFKPHFCQKSFYLENQNNFYLLKNAINQISQKIKPLLTHQQKTKAYLQEDNIKKLIEISLWTITTSALRRPDDWFSQQSALMSDPQLSEKINFAPDFFNNLSEVIKISELFKMMNIEWPKKLNSEMTWIDFLNTVKIKPLPLVAHQSLLKINLLTYPLLALDYAPTPQELLQIQCDFHRILTFEDDFTNWPNKMYGHRDPLSFWLHDIIHAEHFFAHPDLFRQQIGFYRFILNLLNKNYLQESIPLNSQAFQEAFEYLISDMNSHPLHLLKTFKALVEIHFGSQNELIFNRVALYSEFSQTQKDALQNLNTVYFSPHDCDALLNYLSGLVR